MIDRTRAAIDAVCLALLDQEAELTRLDQVVGDGDLGTALARGARAWLQDPIDGSAAQLLRRLSEYARREIGGTSGPLYAAGLLRASERLADGGGWPHAFVAGVEAIKELGGAAVGDRTMIDALEPAAAAAGDGLDAAVDAARAGAASTTRQRGPARPLELSRRPGPRTSRPRRRGGRGLAGSCEAPLKFGRTRIDRARHLRGLVIEHVFD